MRLYLIRHAHTQFDPQRDATQWVLSTQGAAQVRQLAQQPFWAAVTRIVVSGEAKTRLTVEPVLAERGLPVVVDAHFDELRRDGYVSEADYLDRVAQAFAQPNQAVGDWEPAAQARQRVVTGIAKLVQRFPTETVALVGHGLSLSLYRADLLGQRTVHLADWQQLAFAAVALVDPVAGQLLQDFAPVAAMPAEA